MIQLPEKVKFIINTIMEAGCDAYAVGGCIRDSILGRSPDDWDITTSASPLNIKALFKRTIDTGIKHGTVTVMLDKEGFEVTTYRIDGEYEDSRHPREVTFTANLTEDLKRRDFTINAMAYNEATGLVDKFGGIKDIGNRMIRCVGSPAERFTEDALRMMRAVRFSAQLGYKVEQETAGAIKRLAPRLLNISAERIQTELVKLLVSPNPDFLRLAYETGITSIILPEFDACMQTPQNNPHHCCQVGEHTLMAMKASRPDKVLRLALLLHDIGKPSVISTDENGIQHFYKHPVQSEAFAEAILKRLKFDNDTIYKVTKLVRYHDYEVELTAASVRRAMVKIGVDIFPLLFEVKYADILAQSEYKREEKLNHLEAVKQIYQTIISEGQCVSLKSLHVNGRDLIENIGIKPGGEIGEVLKELLRLVIEEPERNTREYLMKAAEEIYSQLKINKTL